ncbi:hypothetical protein FRAAL6292 [Frankia alni ACN14a]|uniref:Uncharacterized protein n=1 Tax=Frankia alni (strain DSM 45986 / CECT 9034 / ACN14a) TaxID=326424 RepID=Q0RCB2_FRAAA|nr:hypothetical protein FRAAL6292 [Frankia alni ACN14a]
MVGGRRETRTGAACRAASGHGDRPTIPDRDLAPYVTPPVASTGEAASGVLFRLWVISQLRLPPCLRADPGGNAPL